MVFGVVDTIAITSLSKRVNTLEDQLTERIGQMESEVDERFPQSQERLKQVAEAVNKQAEINAVRDERVNELLVQTLKRQKLDEERNAEIMRELHEDEKMTIRAIDTMLKIDTTVGTMSEAELHLDLAIMAELRNANATRARKIFDKDKIYEARIEGGLLNLRTYRQRVSEDEEEYKQQRDHITQIQGKLCQETAKLANVTAYEVMRLQDGIATVRINTTGWKYENLTRYDFRENQTNIADAMKKGLAIIGSGVKSALKGAENVVESGIKTIGGVFGGALGSILKPLSN